MKKILILIWLIIMNHMISAQRLLPKQKGIEINTGKLLSENSNNYFLNAGLVVHSQKGNYMLYAMEYSKEMIPYRLKDIAVETYYAEAGYSILLIADYRKSLLLHATLSAIGGYESFNRGEQILFDGSSLNHESAFIYGAGGRLSFEVYLSDRLVMMASARTNLLWNTSRDFSRASVGIGLRINL
jgi:hypothetical protein